MKGTYGTEGVQAKGSDAGGGAAQKPMVSGGAATSRYISSTSRMDPRLMAISVESSPSGCR